MNSKQKLERNMPQSLYLERFKKLNKLNFTLYSDRIWVELLPTFESKTKHGIIITTETDNYRNDYQQKKSHFAVVLVVGEGWIDEEGKTVPLNVSQGDIIMIPSNTQWLSQFGPMQDYTQHTIGLTLESNIVCNFGPTENFNLIFETLNDKI